MGFIPKGLIVVGASMIIYPELDRRVLITR